MVEFKKYLIAWAIFTAILFVIGLVFGTINYFLQLDELFFQIILLVIGYITMYYVAKWRQVSFWKLFGFNILATITMYLIIFILAFIYLLIT